MPGTVAGVVLDDAPVTIIPGECSMTNSQTDQREKRNLRTGIVLATIAAVFFFGFLFRRLLFQ
jgi:hypothetical protein